jgi:hypothetical protein
LSMSSGVYIPTGSVLEGNDVWIVQRVVLPDGEPLQTADIAGGSNIHVHVFDLSLGQNSSRGEIVFEALNLSTADGVILFDTLQTDGYWNGLDEEGYNFRYQLQYGPTHDAADGPHMIGGRRYLVEFDVNTTSYGRIRFASVIQVHNFANL